MTENGAVFGRCLDASLEETPLKEMDRWRERERMPPHLFPFFHSPLLSVRRPVTLGTSFLSLAVSVAVQVMEIARFRNFGSRSGEIFVMLVLNPGIGNFV